MRPFRVRLPSGRADWTIIDDGLRLVPPVGDVLQHIRFGRDLADSTTRAYAGRWWCI